MKKIKKIIWCVVLVLVVIAIIAIGLVALNLDRIVKSGVEYYGPKITGVSITLDQVHIGLLTGSASVENLVVGNPTGYKTPQAFSVGDVSVAVNPFTVLSKKIVVRSIEVKSPEITFEGGLAGNNLSAILANVDGSGQSVTPATTNSPPPTATAPAKPAPKLEVDDLVISGAKVSGDLTLFAGRELPIKDIPIPDIHLTNLGTGPDGITAADLTSQVLHAITSATLKAVASEATNLGGSVKDLGDKGAGSVKKALDSLFGK